MGISRSAGMVARISGMGACFRFVGDKFGGSSPSALGATRASQQPSRILMRSIKRLSRCFLGSRHSAIKDITSHPLRYVASESDRAERKIEVARAIDPSRQSWAEVEPDRPPKPLAEDRT